MEVCCEEIEISSEDEDDVIILDVVRSQSVPPVVEQKINTGDIHSKVTKINPKVHDNYVDGVDSFSDSSLKTEINAVSVVSYDALLSNAHSGMNTVPADGFESLSMNGCHLQDSVVRDGAVTSDGKMPLVETKVTGSWADGADVIYEKVLPRDGRECAVTSERSLKEVNVENDVEKSCAIDSDLVLVQTCSSTLGNVNSSGKRNDDEKNLHRVSVCSNAELSASSLESIAVSEETLVKYGSEDFLMDGIRCSKEERLRPTGASNRDSTDVLPLEPDTVTSGENSEQSKGKNKTCESIIVQATDVNGVREVMSSSQDVFKPVKTDCRDSEGVSMGYGLSINVSPASFFQEQDEVHDISCHDESKSSVKFLLTDSISTFEETKKAVTELPACVDEKLRKKPVVVLMKSGGAGHDMRTMSDKESVLLESNGIKTADKMCGKMEVTLSTKRKGRPVKYDTKWNLSVMKKSGPVRDHENRQHPRFSSYTRLVSHVASKPVIHKTGNTEGSLYCCSGNASLTLLKRFREKASVKCRSRGRSSAETNVSTCGVGSASQAPPSDTSLGFLKNDRKTTEVARDVSRKRVVSMNRNGGKWKQRLKMKESKDVRSKYYISRQEGMSERLSTLSSVIASKFYSKSYWKRAKSSYSQRLEKKVVELVGRKDKQYYCTVCFNVIGKSQQEAREHIIGNHLRGKYLCTSSGCAFSSNYGGPLARHQKACLKKRGTSSVKRACRSFGFSRSTNHPGASVNYACKSVGCSFRTSHPGALARHQKACLRKRVTSSVKYACKYFGCLYSTSYPPALGRHQRICLKKHLTSSVKHACSSFGCPFRTSHPGALARHQKACLKKRGTSSVKHACRSFGFSRSTNHPAASVNYACKSFGCSFRTSHPGALARHQKACLRKRVTSSVKYACKYFGCLYSTSYPPALGRHQRICLKKHLTSSVKHACSSFGCPFRTSHPGALARHQRACLKKRMRLSIKYTCSSFGCSYSTSYAPALGRHQKACSKKHVTSSVKKYTCSSLGCSYSTSYRPALGRHQKACSKKHVTSSVKKYACSSFGCSYCTSYRPALGRHQKACSKKHVTSSVKKYTCSSLGCSYSTSYRPALGRHQKACLMKRYASSVKYACSSLDCSFNTSHPAALAVHQKACNRRHMKSKPNKCHWEKTERNKEERLSLSNQCSTINTTYKTNTLHTPTSSSGILKSNVKSPVWDICERSQSSKVSSLTKNSRQTCLNMQSSEKTGHSERLAGGRGTLKGRRCVQHKKRLHGKRTVKSGTMLKTPHASGDLSKKSQHSKKVSSAMTVNRAKRSRSSVAKGADIREKVSRFLEEPQFASEEEDTDSLLESVGTTAPIPASPFTARMVAKRMNNKKIVGSADQGSTAESKDKKKICKTSCEGNRSGIQIVCSQSLADAEPFVSGQEIKNSGATIEIDRADDLGRSLLYNSCQFVEMDSVQTSVQARVQPLQTSVQSSAQSSATLFSVLFSPSHITHPNQAFGGPPPQAMSQYLYPVRLPSHSPSHVPRQLDFRHNAASHVLPAHSALSGGPWNCRFCNLLFLSPADVVRHENLHLGDLK